MDIILCHIFPMNTPATGLSFSASGERGTAPSVRRGVAPHVPTGRNLHTVLRVHDAHDCPLRHHTPAMEKLTRF